MVYRDSLPSYTMSNKASNRQVLAAILIKFCENHRVLQEPSSSARTVEFCENRCVLQDRSSLVTTENSLVGCAAK